MRITGGFDNNELDIQNSHSFISCQASYSLYGMVPVEKKVQGFSSSYDWIWNPLLYEHYNSSVTSSAGDLLPLSSTPMDVCASIMNATTKNLSLPLEKKMFDSARWDMGYKVSHCTHDHL